MIDKTIMFNWAYTTINGTDVKLTIKVLGDSHKSNVAYYDDINSNISYEDNIAILKTINENFKNITMLFKKVIPTKIADGVFLYYSPTNGDIKYMLDHPTSTVFALAKKFDAFSGIGIKGNIFKLNKGSGYQILSPSASDPIIIGFKYYDPYYIPLCGMSRRVESEMLDAFKFKANSTQVLNRKKKVQYIDTVFIPGDDMQLPSKDYLYQKYLLADM